MFAVTTRPPAGLSNSTVTVNSGSSSVQRFRNSTLRKTPVERTPFRRTATNQAWRRRAYRTPRQAETVASAAPAEHTTLTRATTPPVKSLNHSAAPSNPTATPANTGITATRLPVLRWP